ncbi:efflux RND transporter permease subunit [Fictibacillus fluitans]|uniref:Efflux RND transporter permease subunit n=1 Tax=Fictibacillus fluitans TaxID=3058422 RepID=A0ABT8HQC3_9BACL|nr:efflux RND transporter permease subunit [Fictibacillus sp. NE201]MDN4522963.1 efflux RND transporter permease subunit [Fictibacillus sp. NE201]
MKTIFNAVMNRAILMITLIVLIMVWGAVGAWKIQRDYLPEISNATLTVSAQAQNYSADQVKTSITKPIEQAVRVVNGLEDIETSSYQGGSFVRLNFPMSYDMKQAESEVNAAIGDLELPTGVQKPVVTRLSTHSFPIMSINLTSSSANVTENGLRTLIQDEIADELKTVPGVKDVKVTGGGKAGYSLQLKPEKLKSAGLTIDDVRTSLERNHSTMLQGNVTNQTSSFPIQVTGWVLTKKDLMQMPIKRQDGQMIPLSRVADISNAVVNLQTISRTNGVPSVQLDVLKTSGSTITEVGEKVKNKLSTIPEIKNHEVKSAILFDQSKEVEASLKGLVKEGLLGCLFSMICVFLFFRQVRSTLLIVLSLPVCLLATTGVLYSMGISLNLLTVSGLIVAMGRVVDDSIVILDNMNRKVQEAGGRIRKNLVAGAVAEMLPAIISSTATTIAVYIPIALIGGLIRSAFSGFAWSVVIALVISLTVAMFVVPALYYLVSKTSSGNYRDPLESHAEKLLNWGFQYEKRIVAVILILFVLSGAGAAFLPVNFLPMTHKPGQIGVRVELPQTTSLENMEAEVEKLEDQLKGNHKISGFSSILGSSLTPESDDVFDAGGGWIQQPNVANLLVSIKPGTNVDSFMKGLQKQLDAHSGKAIYTVTNQRIAGDDSQLKINLTGADTETLEVMGQNIGRRLSHIPGLAVENMADEEGTVKRYRVNLDQKAIQRNGIKVNDVLERIQFYTSEGTIGQFNINDTSFPVLFKNTQNLSQNEDASDALARLSNEMFTTNKGQQVKLRQLATVEADTEGTEIQEKAGKPYAEVTANIISSDLGGVSKQVKDELGKLDLPENIHYSFSGIPEQVNEMIYEMAIALAFSLLLVLMIVSLVFKGFKGPLSVLICVPLAFIGSVIAMVIFRLEWDLAALVGLLMLSGIVVTNGIVLVDKIERNLAKGAYLEEAVRSAALTRARPILTTALTTVLTVLPLALSSRQDALVSQTLAIVVIGGLVTSNFCSLIIVPVFYKWVNRKALPVGTENERKKYA